MTAPTVAPVTTQSALLLDGIQLLFRCEGGPVPLDSDGNEWILTKLDGWTGRPKPQTVRIKKPYGIGAYRSKSWPNPRIITVEFRVTAPDANPDLIRFVEQRLGAWCADGGKLYLLTVTDPPLRPQTALVELDDAITTIPYTRYSLNCQAHFAAPDPRKWDAQWMDRSAQLPAPSTDGVDYTNGTDFTAGLDYGTGYVNSVAQVANYGTAPVGPFFQIAGPIAQPKITDLVSGWSVTYTGALALGDVLTINCDESVQRNQGGHTCLLNGITNVAGQVLRSGDWPSLDPQGTASYQLASSSLLITTAVLVVSVRSAWY